LSCTNYFDSAFIGHNISLQTIDTVLLIQILTYIYIEPTNSSLSRRRTIHIILPAKVYYLLFAQQVDKNVNGLLLQLNMQHLSKKTNFLTMSSSDVTRLSSSVFTKTLFTLASVVLLFPLVLADLRRDAISPSSDRFPSFALKGHRFGTNFVASGYPPRRGQLKSETLLKKLGSDFDIAWMSIERPVMTSNISLSVSNVDDNRYEDLAALNFTYRDEGGEERVVKPLVRKYLEKWLLQRASCPVRMTWVDIGLLFWPRWIRKGTCDDSSSTSSCSWPPGMHCVAKPHRPLRLLHWTCQARHKSASVSGELTVGRGEGGEKKGEAGKQLRTNWDSNVYRGSGGREKYRCRWKKTRYQITSECVCSC